MCWCRLSRVTKGLAELLQVYFSVIGDQITQRRLDEISSPFRRFVALVAIWFITTLIFPFAAAVPVGEEVVGRWTRPWRVEMYSEGKWRDMSGYKTLEQAVEYLSFDSRDTIASWRIRRGNEIYPAELFVS